MARTKSIRLRERLTSLLPAKLLWTEARQAGFVVRSRKIAPPAFVWTLVFGCGFGKERTLAGLRRAYETSTGTRLAPSAFRDRFDASLVRYLQALVARLLARLVEPSRQLAGELAAFKEVLVTDSTLVRLHDLLAKDFPGSRTNHSKAALKLHVLMTVNGYGPKSVKLTHGRKGDGKVLQLGDWVEERLLLFDLGYYRYQLFENIRRRGGYFLSRLKANANPTIVGVHRRWRGASVPLVGERLQDVLGRLQREELDLEIEVEWRRRKYAGKRSKARERFRLVGLRNEETGAYHLYVTNLPADRFSARDVAATYRARWTVELFFKSLKSDFGLDQIPSRNRQVVLSLLYASILTCLASRELLVAVRKLLAAEGRAVPQGRWARLLRTWAAQLLQVVTWPPRHVRPIARALESTLLAEAPDPHRSRLSLGEEVELGIPFATRAPQRLRGFQPKRQPVER